MGCSQGSVKTHCSRATHALAAFLKSRGIDLMNEQDFARSVGRHLDAGLDELPPSVLHRLRSCARCGAGAGSGARRHPRPARMPCRARAAWPAQPPASGAPGRCRAGRSRRAVLATGYAADRPDATRRFRGRRHRGADRRAAGGGLPGSGVRDLALSSLPRYSRRLALRARRPRHARCRRSCTPSTLLPSAGRSSTPSSSASSRRSRKTGPTSSPRAGKNGWRSPAVTRA